jgi:hypothetical protein
MELGKNGENVTKRKNDTKKKEKKDQMYINDWKTDQWDTERN